MIANLSSGRIFPTFRFLLALGVAILFNAHSLLGQGFKSAADFHNASGDEVKRRLDARPLDLSKTMDKTVRRIMDELDSLSETHTTVYWADGYGSSAHPIAGVGVDRGELAKLANDKDFEDVVRFVLAHEQAHMGQFREYSAGLDDRTKTRAVECQADILGGFTFMGSIVRKGRLIPQDEWETTLKRVMKLAERLGSPGWDDQSQHPSPEQRERAVSLGILSQLQTIDWQTYEKSKDPQILTRLRRTERDFPDIYKPGETFFAWSNRAAKQIVGYKSN